MPAFRERLYLNRRPCCAENAAAFVLAIMLGSFRRAMRIRFLDSSEFGDVHWHQTYGYLVKDPSRFMRTLATAVIAVNSRELPCAVREIGRASCRERV